VIEWEVYPEVVAEVSNDSLEVFEVVSPEIYYVTFKKDNEIHKAKLNKEGKLIESKKSLTEEKIPKAVTESLANSVYKDWTVISEKEEIKNVAEKEALYRIVVQKDNKKHILYFEKSGKIAKILTPA
jgi:hypothetical protein